MMGRLGIFGGTFDPPHLGHLILAEECHFQLELDRLLWVVTADPPHKIGQVFSPVEMRVKLAQAAVEEEAAFEISLVDIQRPGPHYAVDTIRLTRQAYPAYSVGYIMGGDSLHNLPTWYHPQEIVQACDFIGVMRRPGDDINLPELEAILPGLSAKVEFVRAPLLEISSREIRERIRAGQPFRHYLPSKVYELIMREGWYHPRGD
ncbi:nicotinate-nucleotide adenylyltransferase [Ornatilinea apprima]|nr:nicotinate-nucleotide adenylyltransferase [Ornatilinea apprima]